MAPKRPTDGERSLQLAENLRLLLRSKGIKGRKLAAQCGVPYSSLFDWTVGRTPKNLAALARVAEVLEIPLYNLLFGEDDPMQASDKESGVYLREGNLRITIEEIDNPTSRKKL